MTATEAQNQFGHLMQTVARNGVVAITKHGVREAVLLSAEEYDEMRRSAQGVLNRLTAEFDALLDGMQGPEARRAALHAYRAEPDGLAAAAAGSAPGPRPRRGG